MLGQNMQTGYLSCIQGTKQGCRGGLKPTSRTLGSSKPFKRQFSRLNKANRAAGEATSQSPAAGSQGQNGDSSKAHPGQLMGQSPSGLEQTSSVTFAVSHRVAFGQSLVVVGGAEPLGAWNHSQGAAMEWSEGDTWTVKVQLPPGKHEFKLVVAGQGGRVDWEAGDNRVVEIPDPVANEISQGDFGVVCEWSRTDTTLATPPERVSDLGGEAAGTVPATAAGNTQEGSVGKMTVGKMEVGKMEMEGTPPSSAAPPGTPPAPGGPRSAPSQQGSSRRPAEEAAQKLGAPGGTPPRGPSQQPGQAQQSGGIPGTAAAAGASAPGATPLSPTPASASARAPAHGSASAGQSRVGGSRQQGAVGGPPPAPGTPPPTTAGARATAPPTPQESSGGASTPPPAAKQQGPPGSSPPPQLPPSAQPPAAASSPPAARTAGSTPAQGSSAAGGAASGTAGVPSARSGGASSGPAPGPPPSQFDLAEMLKRVAEREWEAQMRAQGARNALTGQANSRTRGQQQAAGVRKADSTAGTAGVAGSAGAAGGELSAADSGIWEAPAPGPSPKEPLGGQQLSAADDQPGAGAARQGGQPREVSPDSQRGDVPPTDGQPAGPPQPSEGGAVQTVGKMEVERGDEPGPGQPQAEPKVPGKMTVGKMEVEGGAAEQEGVARRSQAASEEPAQAAGVGKMTVRKMEIEDQGSGQPLVEDASGGAPASESPSQSSEAGKMTVGKMEVEGGPSQISGAPPSQPALQPESSPQQQQSTPAPSTPKEAEQPNSNEQAVGKMTVGKMEVEDSASLQGGAQELNSSPADQAAQQEVMRNMDIESSSSQVASEKDGVDEPPVANEIGTSAVGKMEMAEGKAEISPAETKRAAAPVLKEEVPGKKTVGKMEVERMSEPAAESKPTTPLSSQPPTQEKAGKMTVGKLEMDSSEEEGGGFASKSPSDAPAETKEAAVPLGVQATLAALGVLALPVVAWSEFQLNATGCGLPPGPNGALGAAEGVAYLTVGGTVLWSLVQRIRSGKGLPEGPGGLLKAVEGGSWIAATVGAVVLFLQVQTYGYIPSALPDSNCYGEGSGSAGGTAALERTLPDVSAKLSETLSALKSSMAEAPAKLSESVKNLQRTLPALHMDALPLIIPQPTYAYKEETAGTSMSQAVSTQVVNLQSVRPAAVKTYLVYQPEGQEPSFARPRAAGGSAVGSQPLQEAPPGPLPLNPQACLEASCIPKEQQLVSGAQIMGLREAFAGVKSAWLPLAQIPSELVGASAQPSATPPGNTLPAAEGLRAEAGREGGAAPGPQVKKVVQKAKEGRSTLADPAMPEEEPPLQKPVLEAVQKLKQTDVTPIMTTLKQVFGDLKEGFVGLAQTISSGDLSPGGSMVQGGSSGSSTASSTQQQQLPMEQNFGVAVAGEASKVAGVTQGKKGSARVGDNLREAIERTDVQVASAAKELGKQASALAQRVAEVAEGVEQPGARQQRR